ncbi:MAG: lytic transglycosylase domain-containing protein [Clostridiales bacterium]|nr:lytic transglycosylase domain-containing protein [Clostridiales bacterium]MCF8023796.1 lytic transglycosylase domain-containing protein [Clostridiales bacterium]
MNTSLRVTCKNVVERNMFHLLIPMTLTLIICALIFFSYYVTNERGFVSEADESRVQQEAESIEKYTVSDWGALDSYKPIIKNYASIYDVNPALVRALILHESEGNVKLVSCDGAVGLMQCMPDKFREGEDPFNPGTNIKRGTQYLARMMDKFGTVRLAVAAYNAGPGAVEKYGGVPPYEETRAFVPRVVSTYINYLPVE